MTLPLKRAAAIGGGVIGGGWIARLLLNGVDVAVHDPNPEAPRQVGELLENAARAYGRLGLALPPRGRLSFHASIAEAVAGAELVQESAPEQEDLKIRLLAEIDRHAPADAIVGSSTSGLLPTRLQAGMRHPERLVVAHPFNPVYLLPLVEIVGGEKTSAAAIDRAKALYAGLGMKPLHVRKEIDAFIADRILEAYWREALWLVADGVATVEEVDDAIRYGAGLRWAAMGTFQVYRIAGGEAGMRHFISQFGPALKWPWTKLMDVPELTDDLIDTITEQSDAQAGGLGIRALERKRDDCLTAILKALEGEDWGAGAVLAGQRRALLGAPAAETREPRPLALHAADVPEGWLDYNGHMTEHRYLEVFADASDALLAHLGVDAAYLAGGRSLYTAETRIRYLREVKAGTRLAVTTWLLGHDEKRLSYVHEMTDAATGAAVATGEHMLLHVDTGSGGTVPMPADLLARIAALEGVHRPLVPPSYAGLGMRRLGA
jgi:carnitine 3-dehydrogenase